MRFYRQGTPASGRVWIEDEFGDRVAEIDVGQLGPLDALKVGSLFHASPRLLAALEMMLDKFGNEVREGEAGYDAVCAALEAVANAKGE